MKNLKVNKALVTLGMALGVTLLSSCGKNVEEKEEENDKFHKHLYLTIGDQIVVFKECEGYKININSNTYSSAYYYTIYDNEYNQLLFSGEAINYSLIRTNHSYTDSIDEFIESKENVKVYTLEK